MREKSTRAVVLAVLLCIILAMPMLATTEVPTEAVGLHPTEVFNTSSVRYPTWDGEPLFTLHICVPEESSIAIETGDIISRSLRDIGIEGVVHEVPFWPMLLGLYPEDFGVAQYGFERPCLAGAPELVTVYAPQDIHFQHMQDEGVMWCGAEDSGLATPPGYGNNWDESLTKRFQLPSGTSTLSYSIQYDLEPDYDFVLVELSTDGVEWQQLAFHTGVSAGFEEHSIFLNEYAAQTVDIRFRVYTDVGWSDEDGGYDSDGACRIDWVEITGLGKDEFTTGFDGWEATAEPIEITVMQGYDIAFHGLNFYETYGVEGFYRGHSESTDNQGYSNPTYDALWEELDALPINWDEYPPDLNSPDGVRALEILKELQTIWDEEQPALVLFNRVLWGENPSSGFPISPWNLANEHLANPEVRRAINIGLNRQAILDLYGYEPPWETYAVDTWLAPWHPAFDPVSYAEYDIMHARQILFDAGYYNIIAVEPQRDYGHSVVEVFNDLGEPDGFAIAGTSMNNYGDIDFLLVRTDIDGNELWRRTYDYGDYSANGAYDIVQCSDGGFALVGQAINYGSYFSDVLLVRTNSDGEQLWSMPIDNNGQNDIGYALLELSDGGFAIAAATSEGPGSAGPWNGWLVITDSMGEKDETNSIEFELPNEEFPLDIITCPDGGYALAGYSIEYTQMGQMTMMNMQMWLLRVNADGTWWDESYGDESTDYGTSIIMTDDGGFAIGGMTYGYGAKGLDAWVVKTDAMGVYQWNETYGGDGYEQGTTLVNCESGGYALGATTFSYDTNSYDFWLLRFSSDWNIIGSETYGGPEYDFFWSMVQTENHGFAMVGWTGMAEPEVLLILVPPLPVDIREYVLSLPDEAFWKNPDQRGQALANKLDAVTALIDGGFYQEAIDKLQYDIRPKVDGLPDPEDWVIDVAAQEELCRMIDALIAYLTTLL